MGATSDWIIRDADLSAGLRPEERLGFAVKHALLASSALYWPSWEYQILDDVVELVAKGDPVLEAMDHEGRETMIGCGLSLQLFKLTLKHLGCLGRVELFPRLDQPMLAARIHAGDSAERGEFEAQLFAAISQKDPDPPLANGLLAPETAMSVLEQAIEDERAWLQFAKMETSWQRLHTLAIAQPRLEVEEIRFRSEAPPQLEVKVRASSTPGDNSDDGGPSVALSGTFAVLKTKTDDKHGWLAAGQALARLILRARISRISCALHSESLRSAHVRCDLRTEIGRKGYPQAILRFGLKWRPTPVQATMVPHLAPVRRGLELSARA